MKAQAYEIEVTATLKLSKRELQLLNHICSYNSAEFAKGVASTGYAGGVTADEVVALMQAIRAETDQLMHQIEEGKKTIFKN